MIFRQVQHRLLLTSNDFGAGGESLKDDKFSAFLAVIRLREFYQQGKLQVVLNRKSKLFLDQTGRSYHIMVKDAIESLETSQYFRGPSPVHHHEHESVAVYEFIVILYQGNMYIKFYISTLGAELRSFHPAEKAPDQTFLKFK